MLRSQPSKCTLNKKGRDRWSNLKHMSRFAVRWCCMSLLSLLDILMIFTAGCSSLGKLRRVWMLRPNGEVSHGWGLALKCATATSLERSGEDTDSQSRKLRKRKKRHMHFQSLHPSFIWMLYSGLFQPLRPLQREALSLAVSRRESRARAFCWISFIASHQKGPSKCWDSVARLCQIQQFLLIHQELEEQSASGFEMQRDLSRTKTLPHLR